MLYHFEIFVPTYAQAPCYEGLLTYSRHAQQEALSDRYGVLTLPTHFYAKGAVLIEVETDEFDEVIKQVWRQPYDQTRDLVLVLTSSGFVKTVWINLTSDTHKTLNHSRYVPNPELVKNASDSQQPNSNRNKPRKLSGSL